MTNVQAIRGQILAALPKSNIELVENDSPCGQHSLLVEAKDLLGVARFAKSPTGLGFDYCSNVTGVDVVDRIETSRRKEKRIVDGEETEIERVEETRIPGWLEVVYHLYSMRDRKGPLILRARTGDRLEDVALPSLTPVWRSCELQEREVYDLYGVVFTGHPDLRRLLMWDDFKDHPMRKDYVEPDDYDYEPTPHNAVLDRLQARKG